jgi:solute carrier family 9 (sodium/hydrogen exchanger), member 10/11
LILNFLDERVNSHLFFAYDVARAFIIGQEETDMILPTLIGYKPLIFKIKALTEADATVISKEISLMNEKRPDVAAAVKIRQAARSVLNSVRHSINQMKLKGILDEHNVQRLMNVSHHSFSETILCSSRQLSQ